MADHPGDELGSVAEDVTQPHVAPREAYELAAQHGELDIALQPRVDMRESDSVLEPRPPPLFVAEQLGNALTVEETWLSRDITSKPAGHSGSTRSGQSKTAP